MDIFALSILFLLTLACECVEHWNRKRQVKRANEKCLRCQVAELDINASTHD